MNWIQKNILFCIDVFIFILNYGLSSALLDLILHEQVNHIFKPLWWFGLLCVLAQSLWLYAWGFYNLKKRSQYFSYCLISLVNFCFFAILYCFLFHPHWNFSLFAVFFCVFPFALYFLRVLYQDILFIHSYQVVIFGYNQQTQKIIDYFIDNKNPYLRLKMIYMATPVSLNLKKAIPIVNDIHEFNFYLQKQKPYYVIVDDDTHQLFSKSADIFTKINSVFILASRFIEQTQEYIPLESVDERWILDNITPFQKSKALMKRIFDISLSLILLIPGLPLILILMILIKIFSRGPIFYSELRYGLYHRHYRIYKLRTMKPNSKANIWATVNDPRVTKIGQILRKTHLDELPQLLSILRGTMTFCSLRPDTLQFVENTKKKLPYYNLRYLVKPGLIGWHSVHDPYLTSSYEDSIKKLEYDLYYLKHHNILLDIRTLLRTIGIVLGFKGK